LSAGPFDVALLWTDPEKGPFYSRFGWEHHPAIRTFKGPQASPEFYDAFTMIRFLSDRSKKHRADFESYQVYIGEYPW
jgi:hypothetical protein